ncbi:hypothetical protein D2T29_04300 [Sinirhodobacter populi]|uniref:Type IV pilus biogenesis n=1 Tax=Paenirhodobacter populi TaxID=2306993 RepID=A0A443KMR1_9RHOB|nr:hypothetical protein [Sinirhodobacter populi]RWR34127.1 hypothetical protein D2T29_04300 [Sinirhodobacter populi]
MTPEFALNLSHDGIGLLYRSPGEWVLLGQVSLEAPDFSEEMMDLHARAAKKAEFGVPVSKIIIPASQILYTTVPVSATDEAERLAQIAAALDGLTPYAVEDVVFDWCAAEDPRQVRVAVVARETLREAESFAEDWGFNPASFVAVPEPGAFDGEPWFGQSETVTAQLGAEEGVERDGVPVPLAAAYAAFAAAMPEVAEPEAAAANLFEAAIASADMPKEAHAEATSKDDALRNLFALGEDDWSDLDEADQPLPDAERIAQWRAGKPGIAVTPSVEPEAPAEPETAETPVPVAAEIAAPEPAIEETPVAAEAAQESVVEETPLAAEAVPEEAKEPAQTVDALARVTEYLASHNEEAKPEVEVEAAVVEELAEEETALDEIVAAEEILIEEEAAAPEEAAAEETEDDMAAEDLAPPLLAAAAAAGGGARAALSHRATARSAGKAPRLGGVSRDALPAGGSSHRPEIVMPASTAQGDGRFALAGPGKRPGRGSRPAKTEPRITAQPRPPVQLQTAAPKTRTAAPAPEETSDVPVRRGKPRYLGIILVALLILCMTIVAALADTRAAFRPDAGAESLSTLARTETVAPEPVRLAANGAIQPTEAGVVLPQGITLFSGKPGRVPPPRPAALLSAPAASTPAVAETTQDRVAPSTPGLNLSPRPALRPAAIAGASMPEPAAAPATVAAADLAGATAQAVSVSRHPPSRPRTFRTSIDQALASAIAEPAPQPVVAAAPAPAPAPAAPAKQVVQLPQRTQQQPAAQAQPQTPAQTRQAAVAVRKPDPTEALDEPEPTEVLRKMPTSASVAKQATQANALALRQMNLIGLYGASSNRRALVRMPNGRMIKVAVGDLLDGGRVTAIGDGQLTYQKGVRLYQLKMLQGS